MKSLAVLFVVALAICPVVHAGEQVVGQASVIDGDTIDIHGQRFRFHGVDAPESSQQCYNQGQGWRCGKQAAFALADKIGRQTVSCQVKDTDRYGRSIAVCSAGGIDLNGWMVAQGWAIAYTQYSKDYVGQQAQAQASRKGIWASQFQAPWDYRKSKRK